MAAVQPIVTPAWVVGLFIAVGVMFVPIGAWLKLQYAKVVEIEQRYDGSGSTSDCSISASNEGREVLLTERGAAIPYSRMYILMFFTRYRVPTQPSKRARFGIVWLAVYIDSITFAAIFGLPIARPRAKSGMRRET